MARSSSPSPCVVGADASFSTVTEPSTESHDSSSISETTLPAGASQREPNRAGGDPAFPTYDVQLLSPPFHKKTRLSIYKLLSLYGEHYHAHFGKDMKLRLGWPESDGYPDDEEEGLEGIVTAVAVDENHEVVSHACVIFDPTAPEVGLLGGVITHPSHRRRGLADMVCTMVIEAFDDIGSVLLLGTGSPHAAKLYEGYGFETILGDLGSGARRGYNPEDQGEVIMIRRGESRGNPEGFLEGFYTATSNRRGVVIEPLSRRMWPGMVLLFVAFPHESEKLLMGGIDEGLNAEEAVLKLLDDSAEAGGTLCHVCRHISSGRIIGIRLSRPETKEYEFYLPPMVNRQAQLRLTVPHEEFMDMLEELRLI